VANCGAFTESLIDSQLFGHVKGAFTNAVTNHAGYFQQADDGTLFLDEIGDLPFEAQVKLLRAIEGYPFRPVGSTTDIRADVRVVAATNKDLEKAVTAKEFRQDLFFRLRVIVIRVAPLREHARRHSRARGAFLEQGGSAPQGLFAERDEAPARISLAGQCPPASRRARACHRHGRRARHRAKGSRLHQDAAARSAREH